MSDKLKQTIDMPFRVWCRDNSNKPSEVDEEEWINEKEEYVVTNVFTDLIEGNKAFVLLGKNPEPFKGYGSHRFVIKSIHSVN